MSRYIIFMAVGENTNSGSKILFMLKVLQSSDEPVTDAAGKAIQQLQESLEGIKARWDKLK